MAGNFNAYDVGPSSQYSRHAVSHTGASSLRVNYNSRGEPMATGTPADSQSWVPDLSKTQELFKMLDDIKPLADKSKQELADATHQMTRVAQDRSTMWKTKADDSNDIINKQENEIEELKKRLNEKDQEIKDTENRWTFSYEELKKKARDNIQLLKQNLTTHEQTIEELETARANHKRDIDLLSESNEKIKEQLEKVRADKKNIEAELNTTKTRLSKVMGNKLSDNNPDIADLSDMNRPTKIAEKFSELYDNEWTDAFEEVDEKHNDEKKSTKFLLDILKLAKEHCDQMAEEHSRQISQALCFTRDTAVLHHVELHADAKKQVKDLRKSGAVMSMQNVQTRFHDYIKNKATIVEPDTSKMLKSKRMHDFMNKCIEICWLMSVQDPPLTFGLDVHENEPFDKNRFRPYTKTGARVDYLVWPEMFLKEGARLCKGVAQGAARVQSARERHRNDKNDTSIKRPQTAPQARVSKGRTEEQQSYNYDQGSAVSTDVDSFSQQGTARDSTRMDQQNADSFRSPRPSTYKSESRQQTYQVQLYSDELRFNRPTGVSQIEWENFLSLVKLYGIQKCTYPRYHICAEHYKKLTSVQSDV